MTILKPSQKSNENGENPIAKGWQTLKNLGKKPATPSPWSFVPITLIAGLTAVSLVAILATAYRSPISRIEIDCSTEGCSMTVEGEGE